MQKRNVRRTDFALFKPVSVSEDECWVRTEFSDEHRERTAGYMRLVKLDIDVVDAVLVRQESHRMLVLIQLLAEHVLLSTRWSFDETLERSQSAVEVHVERRRLVDLQMPSIAYYHCINSGTSMPGAISSIARTYQIAP